MDGLILADENHVGPRLVDTQWGDANLATIAWSQMHLLGDECEARQQKREGKYKDRETRLKEFDDAVRANRQLAMALQAQGLNEDAARFIYRSQMLRRKTLALQGASKSGAYLFSLFLELFTGYGYHLWRIVIAYVLMVSLFASLYYGFGLSHPPHISLMGALVLSITAFHGRVFSSPFLMDSPQSIVTAFEAVTGLVFEGLFIAMLTQRFFNR